MTSDPTLSPEDELWIEAIARRAVEVRHTHDWEAARAEGRQAIIDYYRGGAERRPEIQLLARRMIFDRETDALLQQERRIADRCAAEEGRRQVEAKFGSVSAFVRSSHPHLTPDEIYQRICAEAPDAPKAYTCLSLYVHDLCRRIDSDMGIRHTQHPNELVARNNAIYELHHNGVTYKEIARRHSIGVERVRQIIFRTEERLQKQKRRLHPRSHKARIVGAPHDDPRGRDCWHHFELDQTGRQVHVGGE